MSRYMKILVMVVSCLAIGYLSSFATRSGMELWFSTLEKPSFYPGSGVFQPVWTLLYIMMGIAAGLVWGQLDNRVDEVRKALVLFAIQLLLNGLWSVLFFGLKNPLLALLEIIILWLIIYETYVKFSKINNIAGYLMLPYLLWVAFATVLNGSIWFLNQ